MFSAGSRPCDNGGQSSRPLDKGGGGSKKIFLALQGPSLV